MSSRFMGLIYPKGPPFKGTSEGARAGFPGLALLPRPAWASSTLISAPFSRAVLAICSRPWMHRSWVMFSSQTQAEESLWTTGVLPMVRYPTPVFACQAT